MRLVRRSDGSREPALGAIFGAVLVSGGALGYLWLRLDLPRPACQFRAWTGVPCPTCGMTRLAEALAGGDVLAAVAWNPLVFAGLTGVGLWAVASTVRLALGHPGWSVSFDGRERAGLRALAVAALILGWGYLVWWGV